MAVRCTGRPPIECHDTRDCIIQFCPPDDEHMCSKHVEDWNKLIIKFRASSWLILINKCIEMHGQQNIKKNTQVCFTTTQAMYILHKKPAIYVNKIYGSTGHTALWPTCKYRLIQHSVPVNVTVLYAATRDILCKELCKLCLEKGDILEINRYYLQRKTGFVEIRFVNQLQRLMFCL